MVNHDPPTPAPHEHTQNQEAVMISTHQQQEAKRDISSVNFTVTLTGLEIETILSAVGTTTSMWAKNRRQMPGSFDLAALSSGCDKLTNPVEEDYRRRIRGKR